MATNRIKVAKDKAALVRDLVDSPGTTGAFRNYTDVMVFAAVLGVKRKKRSPLGEISQREPGPIEQEYFATKGYDLVINLLAIHETKDREVISAYKAASEEQRIHIFEEYANGGLAILQDELRGAVDYSERLLLILSLERGQKKQQAGEFDLSQFLP